MSINFRSYFNKNNTLISMNSSNNSLNPVTELIHGGFDNIVTRYIFSVDLTNLQSAMSGGTYIRSNITSHVLHMTNTIRNATQYAGKGTYIENMERASGFRLEFFKIKQDWSNGSKYNFNLDILKYLKPDDEVSNWNNAKNGESWNYSGSFSGNSGDVLGYQDFNNGTEDINLDITEYINLIIDGIEDFYGIGIKYSEIIETGTTTNMQSVAFHAKDTNTYYEPYIETQFVYDVDDDRSNFYLDKNNKLFLDLRNVPSDITINSVKIYDYENNVIEYISGATVTTITKGLFSIPIIISSSTYPDAVIFHDEWDVNINGNSNKILNKFYLKSFSEYLYTSYINLDNYHVTVDGLFENEVITQGDIKKIAVRSRELYKAKNSNLIYEYGVFTQIGVDAQLEILPFTKVNKIGSEYSIDLNTIWLIPQDYYLKIRQISGNNSVIKNKLLAN